MSEKGPLRAAEKWMSFYIRGASTRAKTTHLVFDEELADEGFTKAIRC